MAKKITRGITGIKDINKQDFDTNNVNDLLSDGQYNYIHRKKGKSEEYHNLTDNIKTISSDNTDLLTVTNNNKTNNTALISPKHDAQKEQLLESERNTITINHGTNATTEKTKVDTNPAKVLEHENLFTDYGISKTTTGNTTKLGLEYTEVPTGFDLDNLTYSNIRGNELTNAPDSEWLLVSTMGDSNFAIQRAVKLTGPNNTAYVRSRALGVWGAWREQVGDKSVIDGLLAQKQNKLTNSESIAIVDTGLRQLYTHKQTYSESGCLLKTYVKCVSSSTSVDTPEEEFNFIFRANVEENFPSVTFTLNEHDKTKFNNIITTYGTGNRVKINGYDFELNGNTLTVIPDGPIVNYITLFSDII